MSSLLADNIKFRGHPCFRDDWSGFDEIKPINVIIGRNNTGKSQLLDVVETLCSGRSFLDNYEYQCSGMLQEDILRSCLSDTTGIGKLRINYFQPDLMELNGARIGWKVTNGIAANIELDPAELLTPYRAEVLPQVVFNATHELANTHFRRLLADRDIQPEKESVDLDLQADGRGASNIIRRFLLSADSTLSRDVVGEELLPALNQIFGEDGEFTEIQVKVHDEHSDEKHLGRWEVFLGEESKGLIPLSKSGSGLKTIILVLLNLIVVPRLPNFSSPRFTFAFEELENNLHPALLRRLLVYVESKALEKKTPIFISTHSSTALDLFGSSENAQIVHVLHDGRSARTRTVHAHVGQLGVIAELGAKPSDLLQANGIVWVEGPSDRIYVNHWITICSDGELREGIDYQCAYFGGSLLARVTFDASDRSTTPNDLANLLRVNPNIVVVCDSDRTRKGAHIKDRVRRIRKEVQKIPSAHIWITGTKEIENYIPGTVLSKVFHKGTLPDPEQYINFIPRKGARHKSYVTAHLNGQSVDKVKLAAESVRYMTSGEMTGRFDWKLEMEKIVKKIRSWSG